MVNHRLLKTSPSIGRVGLYPRLFADCIKFMHVHIHWRQASFARWLTVLSYSERVMLYIQCRPRDSMPTGLSMPGNILWSPRLEMRKDRMAGQLTQWLLDNASNPSHAQYITCIPAGSFCNWFLHPSSAIFESQTCESSCGHDTWTAYVHLWMSTMICMEYNKQEQ